ncbi:MAG: hypothetical protein ACJAZP_000276 [Psychromonas sp.]|jgi:hypothetical protein|uniref:hypothetical protein n=1 Tax=Psychromonas sp. TaxID=1884585 RepID=UPI0039E413E5
MNKLSPLFCTMTLALSVSAAHANTDNFISDSTLDTKVRSIFYDMTMDYEKSASGIDFDVDASIEDLGASLWLNYQSGLLFNMVGVEIGYQGALIAWQDGTVDVTDTTYDYYNSSSSNVQYYQGDPDASSVGKLANANILLHFGNSDNNLQLKVGRFTPTIYDLLHRPDITFYALSTIYEGAQVAGDLTWGWGKINPWFNYFTGYSSEHSDDTVQFRDLETTSDYDAFDAIYNVGFHTETDYFTASTSYSYAEDYLSNGIIEVYSGIPLSLLGFNTNDDEYYIKYMLKYGMEKGLGTVNEDHSTDMTEFAVGMQAGNLDFLVGVTQIGDDSFYGFETQDGYNAGGGTAVWGDMALLNTFKHADQQTLFFVGGYNLDVLSLPNWRVQATVAAGSGIDMDNLSTAESYVVNQADYTETEIDLMYSKNGYQGQGMSYRLTYGQDNNYNAKGIGIWVEYNGDLLKAFD